MYEDATRERRRRFRLILLICLLVAVGTLYSQVMAETSEALDHASTVTLNTQLSESQEAATVALEKLAVKGRAPKTGYSRQQFGNGWAATGNCTVRDRIMARDFAEVQYATEGDCSVIGGVLHDSYTGTTIRFTKTKSSAIQIDHVIALSDAWQKGAQQLTPQRRAELANDPLELLAVDGPANQEKSDADAATWLPPNKAYRCRYIARQIAVKAKYELWVTAAERDTMRRVLGACPQQVLPVVRPQPQTQAL